MRTVKHNDLDLVRGASKDYIQIGLEVGPGTYWCLIQWIQCEEQTDHFCFMNKCNVYVCD